MKPVYDVILQEILKRDRKPIPSIILTGSRFSEYSEYSISNINKTILESNKFVFKQNTNDTIDFNDYKKELLYIKLFNIKIEQTDQTDWKDLTRSTAIIKINDLNDKVFYMYIKLGIKSYCEVSDNINLLEYRIVYSSSFNDLVTFVYKPYEIPDFLNSNVFLSLIDKNIDQATLINNYNESLIKNVDYNGIIINVNLKNRILTTKIKDDVFSLKYNIKDECFVNEIITRGSNTLYVKISEYCTRGIDIFVGNNIEVLKVFCLKKRNKIIF